MKVCIQAGHSNTTTGQTGAPGEKDWNEKIVPIIAEKLRAKGVEVYETDANAFKDNKVTSTDWDMFLAVHYDADIYNDRGGFVDYPDPAADMVWETSKKLAESLRDHYFSTTGIPERYSRSNANTKFYYMWSELTANTPCVIIECGVGWRKPQDYEILRDYDFIAMTICDGVLKGLGLYDECKEQIAELEAECQKLDDELDEMRDSRDKWRTSSKDWEAKYETDVVKLQGQLEQVKQDLAYEKDKNAQLISSLDICKEDRERLTKQVGKLSADLEKCQEGQTGGLEKYSKLQLLRWVLFNKL